MNKSKNIMIIKNLKDQIQILKRIIILDFIYIRYKICKNNLYRKNIVRVNKNNFSKKNKNNHFKNHKEFMNLMYSVFKI